MDRKNVQLIGGGALVYDATMEIIVGSKNTPKQLAVAEAFRNMYPKEAINVQGVAADSEISDHPTTAEESLLGATNRAKNARLENTEADFYVGIEGGLLRVGDRAWEHSWVVVEDRKGRTGTGVSAGLELKGKLLAAILGGQELGEAFAEQHGAREVGNKNGLYGMSTNDAVTRESATREAVIFALAPFVHPEYFE